MDLENKIIGKITILSFDKYKQVGLRMRPFWNVKCECGFSWSKAQVELSRAIRLDQFPTCRKCSTTKAANTIKSNQHGLKAHPLYQKWCDLKSRLKRDPNYSHIELYKEWDSFLPFYIWGISNGWEDGLEIDRKNTLDGYNPNNCRFVSRFINAQNKRDYKQKGIGNVQELANGKFKVRIQNNNKRETFIVNTIEEAYLLKKTKKDRPWHKEKIIQQ